MLCFEDVTKFSQRLLGLAVLCGCSQRDELVGTASVDELNVPDQIAVRFNHHQRNRYQSPISGEWRDGDDIEQILVQAIELAQHFTREMDRLWDSAELGITPHIQRKLDRQRIRCGDGVERGLAGSEKLF